MDDFSVIRFVKITLFSYRILNVGVSVWLFLFLLSFLFRDRNGVDDLFRTVGDAVGGVIFPDVGGYSVVLCPVCWVDWERSLARTIYVYVSRIVWTTLRTSSPLHLEEHCRKADDYDTRRGTKYHEHPAVYTRFFHDDRVKIRNFCSILAS
ncbi:unnamed protein product [Chrysodeixis includens]|uniref:Uncharacterized protein n=1 Tax=Chrysodeixis includens TaxID=689277 RepID=A0A9N8L5B8_CHRIL|nr:unnamed protein product [Chrysodeixis includens]